MGNRSWKRCSSGDSCKAQVGQYTWGQRAWHGVTVANSATSLPFMLGHGAYHPPIWAAAVLVPSLIFGYFRDHYTSVYPSVTLHAVYNAGYFLLTGLPE